MLSQVYLCFICKGTVHIPEIKSVPFKKKKALSSKLADYFGTNNMIPVLKSGIIPDCNERTIRCWIISVYVCVCSVVLVEEQDKSHSLATAEFTFIVREG